ncbi:MAG: HlyC/CorC family transporter [SAR324 cluster bacterium]|nr:HlyC/CorC family transporter [SAR324 cluster bacterium]
MDIPYAEIAGIVVCLIFSALFSASETALSSLPEIKVQQLLDSRRFWLAPLTLWKHHPNRVLVTILIGNNVANITASVLASDLAAKFFPGSGIPIAIGAMTFILLVTGEITPKTFARTFPTAIGSATMWPIFVFYYVLFPVTFVLTFFVRILISMLGARQDQAKIITEQDLEYVVRMGADDGAFDEDQEHLLQSVIDFTDTRAKQIMVPRTDMVAVPRDSTYEKVVETAIESGLSRIPVYDGSIDKMVGIFYTKNLITPPTEEEKHDFLGKRMRPPVYVPESKKISEILKLFQEMKSHMAIVVNEFGGTEGVVTLEDVVEELLGEIQDEFDTEQHRLVAMPDGGYMADARIDIDELEEVLEIDFPEGRDYESLGGFLMEVAATVPEAGWQHTHGGFRFAVTEADANRVIKVHISVQPEAPQDSESPTTDGDAEDDESQKSAR